MIILGADPLTQFLHEAETRPFQFGEWDCLQVLAHWLKRSSGIDPGAAWRPRYHDQKGAIRIVREAGGMIEHVERCIAPFGLKRRGEIKRGDIALVRQEIKRDPFEGYLGAIVMAPGETSAVIAPGRGGVAIVREDVMPVRAAWG